MEAFKYETTFRTHHGLVEEGEADLGSSNSSNSAHVCEWHQTPPKGSSTAQVCPLVVHAYIEIVVEEALQVALIILAKSTNIRGLYIIINLLSGFNTNAT